MTEIYLIISKCINKMCVGTVKLSLLTYEVFFSLYKDGQNLKWFNQNLYYKNQQNVHIIPLTI